MESIGQSAWLYRACTDHSGLPKTWYWLSRTPLTSAVVADLLRPLAERWQDRAVVPPVFVLVLLHHFERGRLKSEAWRGATPDAART